MITHVVLGQSRSIFRLSAPRTALALIAGCTLLGLPSCSEDHHRPPLAAPRSPEQDHNAWLQVDAAGITGRVDGDRFLANVPVRALETGSGSLELSLRSVDGREVLARSRVDVALTRDETSTLAVSLPAPDGIGSQADLVKFNLSVTAPGDLRIERSLQYVIPPYELQVEGPARVSAGKQVSYRVAARDALTHAPLANQQIQLQLAPAEGQGEAHALTTDETGNATLSLSLAEAGQYSVSARARAFGVGAQVAPQPVQVAARTQRVLLTTDKPIYKPGQTLHLRALSLGSSDRRPEASASLTFEVEDGKGNKVFKKALQTDGYGIASSDFQIGQIVNEGTYHVRAIAGDSTSEKTVQVFQYALPKFKIGIRPDKGWYLAGETVSADLDVRYFFGKPVSAGQVVVEMGALAAEEQLFGRVQSRTNPDGTLHVSLTLPSFLPGLPINAGNALAFLRVTATDTAGQTVSQELPLTVAPDPVLISLVPEAGKLVPGIDNQLDLFLNDPLGAPLAGLNADVVFGGASHPVTSDDFGHARLSWRPSPGDTSAEVHLGLEGTPVSKGFEFAQQDSSDHLLVRTERAVYAVGEDVNVDVLATGSSNVYVDWLNEGQAVQMRTLAPVDGVAHFSLPIDASLLGENRINAYIVQDDGNIVRASRTVFARGNSRLNIAMSSDRPRYAPGEPAQLDFSVTDETGAPAVAALGVQIVDQAVFGVVDAKPGLLSTYFELEDAFAKPSYELQAPGGDLATLLLQQTAANDAPTREAAQTRAAANFAALGEAPATGIYQTSWQATVQASQILLAPYFEARKASLIASLKGPLAAALVALSKQGCTPRSYYCAGGQQSFLDALGQKIAESFVGYDFWGNAYNQSARMYGEALRLDSAGPDERIGTTDDASIVIRLQDLDLASAAKTVFDEDQVASVFPVLETCDDNPLLAGCNAPAAGAAGQRAPAANASGIDSADAAAPRIRQDFPETLYVNPSLITDASGHASISVDMADSITEWRVSALGHTRDGQLGGSGSGITVFQNFFVDVSFPATLTRGDEVDFPIAVYNYLDTPQSVSLDLQPADWFTPLGDTHLSLDLGPGEVRGVSLPVRVESVGLQTLTLTGRGGDVSDAVARRVRVLPDGKAFPVARSGSVTPGSVSQVLEFPAQAVPGSEQLYLNVYPAFLAQAVSGMDSILQVPSGCFEQTTSTTWPNVLVTDYLQKTHQITPELQLKAESLISAGYQRLLTFEHPGGGFSWFGTQDPAPFLSVTAFGLMEFANMQVVRDIDTAMFGRTQSWLVAQQAGDGSWQGDQSEFFTFQTSSLRNTAFVLWALGESGYNGPAAERGLAYVKSQLASAPADERDDAYTLALAANALVLLDDPDAGALLSRLDALKKTDGDKYYWPTKLQTNFYGGGQDADVATTALVAHALLRASAYPATSRGALAYLTAAKDPNGNFGSTQATTWSLKALLLAAAKGTDGAVGSLAVSVDGNPFTQVELRADQAEVMTTVDMTALASTGSHTVQLDFVGTGQVSYNLVGSHHLPWSEVPAEPTGPLSIALSYDQATLAVDESVNATATLRNLTDSTTNMVLVTLGVPPGFEVQMQDFQQYLDAGVLSKAELTGKQLILYVSELAAGQTQRFEYELRATLPVRASDGGAEVALYYEPERKSQAAATTLVAF